MQNFNVLSEITSAVIGILLEDGKNFIKQKIAGRSLVKKIKKREKYLINKYKENFYLFNKISNSSFYEWLKEKQTIKRILSFSNAEDIDNISVEQMKHSMEIFLRMHLIWLNYKVFVKKKNFARL